MMAYAKGRIAHVHLKDQAVEDNRKYVSLGLGAVPNEKIVKALRMEGYDGWYTLENVVGDAYADTARQIAVLKAWTTSHIVAKIAECGRYETLNPHFKKAFEFLKRTDLKDLKVGRYEIDGENCWAMVQEAKLAPLAGSKVEAHRKYIDIQAPITGPETIGLLTMNDAQLALPFNAEKDCVLFDAETKPVMLQPGEFAIFFPPDGAHAPGHEAKGPTTIRKLVIKVKAE